MKQIHILLTLLIAGCSSTVDRHIVEHHPTVVSQQHALGTNSDGKSVFSCDLYLQGRTYRTVAIVSRAFYRRIFEHEVIRDRTDLILMRDRVRVRIEFDSTGRYDLEDHPAHILLYHRTRTSGMNILGEWWVTPTGTYESRPNEVGPHNPIQSSERFITRH